MTLAASLGTVIARVDIARWLYLHPDARTLPYHIDSALESVRREHEANTLILIDPREREAAAAVRAELDDQIEVWSHRRRMERALADYISGVPDPHNLHGLADLVRELRECRRCGPICAPHRRRSFCVRWPCRPRRK